MSRIFESTDDFCHKGKDGKTLLIGNNIKKDWIKLPKEIGGQKIDVEDSFITHCFCGKHSATLYVLKKKYMTINCSTRKQWLWFVRPNNIKDLDKMRFES